MSAYRCEGTATRTHQEGGNTTWHARPVTTLKVCHEQRRLPYVDSEARSLLRISSLAISADQDGVFVANTLLHHQRSATSAHCRHASSEMSAKRCGITQASSRVFCRLSSRGETPAGVVGTLSLTTRLRSSVALRCPSMTDAPSGCKPASVSGLLLQDGSVDRP